MVPFFVSVINCDTHTLYYICSSIIDIFFMIIVDGNGKTLIDGHFGPVSDVLCTANNAWISYNDVETIMSDLGYQVYRMMVIYP